MAGVRQLRVVLTTDDFAAALRLYRDVLGLRELDAVASPGGRVAILDAGRATIELADHAHASYIETVEVIAGDPSEHPPAGAVRFAFEVDDVDAATRTLQEADVELVAPATPTPWGSRNARFAGVDGIQLTLFEPTDRSEPANPGA